MKKTKVFNQQGYDLWSSSYDSYLNPTVAADEICFPPKWQHLKNQRILEIGCGTGRHTTKLLSQGNQVTGLDLSEGMLAEAKKKISNPNVSFIHADFLNYDFKNMDPFDAIIVSLVIEHIEDLKSFFEKANLVLKKEGLLLISEIHPHRTQKGILAHFKLPGSDEEIHLQSSAHSETAILSAAHAAGFSCLSQDEFIGDSEFASKHPKWAKYLNVPMIAMWTLQKNRMS